MAENQAPQADAPTIEPASRQVNVVVAGFQGVLASALTGVVDMLCLAGVSWQRIAGEPPVPGFQVRVASEDGEPVQCLNGLVIHAQTRFSELKQSSSMDVLVIPTIGGPISKVLASNDELLDLIRWAKQQGIAIVGNCTGTFLLAEAGVLNDATATTHWGYQQAFSQRYPQVDLRADLLITHDQGVYCAGGGLAWFDLGLLLIEHYMGYDKAIQTAKAFVIDYRRESQLTYRLASLAQHHQDALVSGAQRVFQQRYGDAGLSLEAVADQLNVSTRTLIRRFKTALKITPYEYLQQLRMDVAQKRLTETSDSLEQVVDHVGYEDVSSFRRLFKRKTGLTPLDYRKRFAKRF